MNNQTSSHWSSKVDYSKYNHKPRPAGFDHISATPGLYLHFAILKMVETILVSFNEYRRKEMTGVQVSTALVAADIESLFMLIQPGIEHDFSKEDYATIKAQVYSRQRTESQRFNDYHFAFIKIQAYLYKKGVTRFDSRVNIDRTSAEAENQFLFGN